MISNRGTIRLARPFDFVRLQEMKPHSAHGLRPFYQMNRASPEKPNEVECPEPVEGLYYVYLLLCCDESLYCGSTKNLRNRTKEHNSGEGAAWTKKRRPVKLIYYETYDSLVSARRRERQIKGWTIQKNLI